MALLLVWASGRYLARSGLISGLSPTSGTAVSTNETGPDNSAARIATIAKPNLRSQIIFSARDSNGPRSWALTVPTVTFGAAFTQTTSELRSWPLAGIDIDTADTDASDDVEVALPVDNTKTTLTISTEPCPDTPEKTDDLVTPFQAARPTSDLTPTLTPTAAVNPKLTSKHNSTGTASNGSPTLIKAIPTTKSHRLPLTLSLPEDYEAALDTKDAILLTSTYAGALQLLGRCDELAKVFLACSEDPTKEEWALVRDAHGRHRLLVRDAWAAAVGAAKAGDNDGAMPKKLQHLLVKETCEGLLADAHAIDVDYCAYVLGCIATLYEHGVISRGGPMASLVFTDPIIRLCGMDAEFDVNYKGHWAALLAFATNASRCIKYDRGFDLMLGAAVRETERRIATFRAKSWAALQRTYGSAEAAAEVVAYVNGIANVLAQRCADDWMRLPSKRRDALQSGPFRLPWTRAFVRDWCAYALPNPHRIPTTEMPEVVIKMMRWVGHCGRDALGAMPQKTLAALGSDLKTTLDACTFCSTWMEASVGSAIGDLPRQVAAECCVRLGGGTMQAGLMAAVGLLA